MSDGAGAAKMTFAWDTPRKLKVKPRKGAAR